MIAFMPACFARWHANRRVGGQLELADRLAWRFLENGSDGTNLLVLKCSV